MAHTNNSTFKTKFVGLRFGPLTYPPLSLSLPLTLSLSLSRLDPHKRTHMIKKEPTNKKSPTPTLIFFSVLKPGNGESELKEEKKVHGDSFAIDEQNLPQQGYLL